MNSVKEFALNLDHPLSVGCVVSDVGAVTSPSRGFTMRRDQWEAIREFCTSASVQSVKYYDADGVQQTLATTVYKLLSDREPAEIALKSGQSWPTVYDEADVVQVNYTAGVADTAAELRDEDEWMKQAVLLFVQAYWLRDHGTNIQSAMGLFERITKAAELICEAHRCGDDFVKYGEE